MSIVYAPKGKVLSLLQAMRDDPHRIFTVPEAAKIMGTGPKGVLATVKYALRAGIMFRSENEAGLTILRGTPFDGSPAPKVRLKDCVLLADRRPYVPDLDDIRIPKVVAGWVPPKMVCVRGV